MLYKSEHMAVMKLRVLAIIWCHLELSKSICSPDISNFIGKSPSFSGHFSLIYKDFINIHSTNMSDKAISRLYGYRTMSEQSFDTNFRSLGLSVTMICVFSRVYRLMLSAFYPQFLKMLLIFMKITIK